MKECLQMIQLKKEALYISASLEDVRVFPVKPPLFFKGGFFYFRGSWHFTRTFGYRDINCEICVSGYQS